MSDTQKSYHFRSMQPVAGPFPEEWRSLDLAVARWVCIHGGSKELARVAGDTSVAEGKGDSALPVSDELAAKMSSDKMVTFIEDGQESKGDTPFAIQHGHFYLRRNFAHEVAVANALQKRRKFSSQARVASVDDVKALFGSDAANTESEAQRDAVSRVLGRRLFVLTGGPGTGKTTTVLRMLLMLLKDRAYRNLPKPVIGISAPTGKAAQRLSESLRSGAEGLRDAKLDSEWLEFVPDAIAADASTLHRLLGSRGPSGGFTFNARNPLPADIVVIDEASMVDLAMLRALLDAMRDEAVLILVGDADQLTSVGTGSVLMDLVTVLEGNDELVRLKHSFRAEAYLLPINQAILRGDRSEFSAAFDAAGDNATREFVKTTADLAPVLKRWAQSLRTVLKEARAYEDIPVGESKRVFDALDALKRRQLLCALRTGDFGSMEANSTLEKALGKKDDTEWFPGRAVMITRNDAAAGLFNGDVGICLREKDGPLRVWFEVTATGNNETPDSTPTEVFREGRRARAFGPGSLPEHQGAFAVTIHKSQGSEYDHVALLLPSDVNNRILSRQLLYTGASRAKKAVELWATDEVVTKTIANLVVRAGGLRERLR